MFSRIKFLLVYVFASFFIFTFGFFHHFLANKLQVGRKKNQDDELILTRNDLKWRNQNKAIFEFNRLGVYYVEWKSIMTCVKVKKIITFNYFGVSCHLLSDLNKIKIFTIFWTGFVQGQLSCFRKEGTQSL